MKLHFVDTNQSVIQALMETFKHDAKYSLGRFEDMKDGWDAIVSPGNSFGIMDGGIDLAIRDYFGMTVQNNVQDVIRMSHFGEQPVGTSFTTTTGSKLHPWLVHSPTMSVPQPIGHTQNVYYAMLATLHAVERHNRFNSEKIETVVCPGLGTLTGQVLPGTAAIQMRLAYENFEEMKKKPKKTWEDFN